MVGDRIAIWFRAAIFVSCKVFQYFVCVPCLANVYTKRCVSTPGSFRLSNTSIDYYSSLGFSGFLSFLCFFIIELNTLLGLSANGPLKWPQAPRQRRRRWPIAVQAPQASGRPTCPGHPPSTPHGEAAQVDRAHGPESC